MTNGQGPTNDQAPMTNHGMRTWGLVIGILLVIGHWSFTMSANADVLDTLRKEHPRLLVLSDDFKKAKENAQNDPRHKVYYDQIVSDCNKFLDQPPVRRGQRADAECQPDGAGKDHVSDGALSDGSRQAIRRPRRDEMLAAAGFDDWNPSHFLDVAEMTAAMAIGYDWLFDTLSPDDRATIRDAIVHKGLKPGLLAYDSGEWWTKVNHNWANVCAGGLALGALAIAEDEPDLARQVLDATRKSMNNPMPSYAPDGGWLEGPGYWNYATRYTVLYAAAAQTALGNGPGAERF